MDAIKAVVKTTFVESKSRTNQDQIESKKVQSESRPRPKRFESK